MGDARWRNHSLPISEGMARSTGILPVPCPNTGWKPVLQPGSLGVQGLLFDMGDVLYDATVWRRWLLQLLLQQGIRASYRTLFKVWDVDFLEAVHRGACDYQHAFRSFLLSVGLPAGLVDEVEAASQARKRDLEAAVRPLPGVRATLARLHAAGLTLGVLSDSECTASMLRGRLDALGIGEHWTTIVSSRDLGQTKPHPLGYRTALAEMQLPAQRVAFVGHDAEELCGAAALGMPTIAFNYEPNVEADVYLECFDHLLPVCTPANRRQSPLAA